MVREKPINITQVMVLTGYSRAYIYKLVHDRRMPCHKPMGRKGRLFFYESEVLDFISRGKQAAAYEVSDAADAILNREKRKHLLRGNMIEKKEQVPEWH